MLSPTKITAILLLTAIVIFSFVSLKLLSPPDVVPASQGDQKFSAERALIFLSVLANEPHQAGTASHEGARDYIFTYCQRMGLETQLTDQTVMDTYPGTIRAARAQNIIARLKGTTPGKAILVMSHYDSQPNTPAATDDGTGVAAMMEVIRMLKISAPLKNDVIFLFTDQEENGLFGAKAFVDQYPRPEEIGLLMNFEARGNAGVSFTFEFSKENGWLMREYQKAVKNPFANSFAYELYKIMPNDTDFSRFRKTGITGFNNAFIDGYSYYHSMADRIENMDIRSLQNQGDILWHSLEHFGNLSLENTKGEDVIFFNPAGSSLWLYPLRWDMPLMILAMILWVVVVFLGIRKKRINLLPLFGGMGLFICFLVLSALLVWILAKLLLFIYPYYSNFYSNNFYNIADYFVAVSGIIALTFVLLFNRISGKDSHESALLGSIFLLLLVMVAIKVYLNTGAYLIYYPIIILMSVYVVLFAGNVTRITHPVGYGLAQLLFIVPGLLLWMPYAYFTFIAFSLILPFGPVVILSFCVPFLIPALGYARSLGRWTIWIFPAGLLLWGLTAGQIHSMYNRRQPLQTELMYALDVDNQKAYWVSSKPKRDAWTKHYFPGPSKEKLEAFYPNRNFLFWKAGAPFEQLTTGRIKVLKDSVAGNKRFLKINVAQDTLTYRIRLLFPDGVSTIALNGQSTTAKEEVRTLDFIAPGPGGIVVELEMGSAKPGEITVIEHRAGLPSQLMTAPLPEDFIFGPDGIANTTQVKYTVKI